MFIRNVWFFFSCTYTRQNMFFARKYVFFLSYFIIASSSGNIDTEITNKTRVILSMIEMGNWGRMGKTLPQKIFIQPIKNEIADELPTVDENNVDEISSKMYTSLTCYSIESIRILLNNEFPSTDVQRLTDINMIVLKTVSVLLHFIEIAPNVMSHEPGILTTLLSLNMHIVRLIRFTNQNQRQNNLNLLNERKVMHLINLIERSEITNSCLFETALAKAIDNQTIYTSINEILIKTGLSTTNIIKFINMNNSNFNAIIIQVAEQLAPILNIDQLLIETIKNDTENVFLFMDFIYDSIMQIVNQIILEIFEQIEDHQNTGNIKKLDLMINNWIQKDLIKKCEILIQDSQVKKFPMFFTNKINLFLRIVKIMISKQSIPNLTIIKNNINENLYAIRNKKRPGLSLLSRKTIFENKYDLYELQKEIVAIKAFKYFNQIYILLQNVHKEYDLSEIELNKMKYNIQNNKHAVNICKETLNVYNLCNDIRLSVMACSSSKCLLNLKENFILVLNTIRTLSKNVHSYNDFKERFENFDTISSLLNRYLTINIKIYPKEKYQLHTILYYTTNLIDKYQIHNCEPLTYRNAIYRWSIDNMVYDPSSSTSNCQIETNSKKQNDFKTPEQLFDTEEVTAEIANTLMIKNYILTIDQLHYPEFYWQGQLRTIVSINIIIDKNLFNFSSFAKYTYMFHKWLISLLFYTMIDVLEYFQKRIYVKANDEQFMEFVQKLPSINFPEHFLPVINTIGNAQNLYQVANVIEYKMLFEESLSQNGIQLQTTYNLDEINNNSQKLKNIFETLWEVFNKNANLTTSLKTNKKDKKPKKPIKNVSNELSPKTKNTLKINHPLKLLFSKKNLFQSKK